MWCSPLTELQAAYRSSRNDGQTFHPQLASSTLTAVQWVVDESLAGFGSVGVDVVRVTLNVNGMPMSNSPIGTLNFAVAEPPAGIAPNVQVAVLLCPWQVDVELMSKPDVAVAV